MNGFVVERELNRSSKGAVKLARRRKDGLLVVLKERRQAELGRGKSILNEVRLLSLLKHDGIVKLLSHFDDHGVLVMELEYAEFGDLSEELALRAFKANNIDKTHHSLPWLSSMQVLQVMQQILLPLQYLYEKRVIHRDIKSSNIFVFESKAASLAVKGLVNTFPDKRFMVKIGDLGVSRMCSEETSALNTFYGTPLYASPEICKATSSYDHTTDLWSTGVLFYELLTLQHPFTAKSIMALTDAICTGTYTPLPPKCNTVAREVVNGMLQVKPSERLSVNAALAKVNAAIVEKQALSGCSDHTNNSSIDIADVCGDEEHSRPMPSTPNGKPSKWHKYHRHSKDDTQRTDNNRRSLRAHAANDAKIAIVSNSSVDAQGKAQRIQAQLRRARLKLKNISEWNGCDTEQKRDAVIADIAKLEKGLKLILTCTKDTVRHGSSANNFYSTCLLPQVSERHNAAASETTASFERNITDQAMKSLKTEFIVQKKIRIPKSSKGSEEGTGKKHNPKSMDSYAILVVDDLGNSSSSTSDTKSNKQGRGVEECNASKTACPSLKECVRDRQPTQRAVETQIESDYITRQRVRVARYAARLEEQRRCNRGKDFCIDS